jgi:hypothetical protein
MVPAQSTCSTTRDCWLRAWDRAKSEKLIPFRNADGTWSCKSYTIAATGPGWSALSCTCAAGRNGRICKHVAVTAKAIAVGVRPIRPALVAQDRTETDAFISRTFGAPAFRPTASVVLSGSDPLAVAFN